MNTATTTTTKGDNDNVNPEQNVADALRQHGR
jgi:hypothetical protein